MSTGFWGADTGNEIKPIWQFVRDRDANGSANVFASDGGWTMRWPWGDEVLITIGSLPTKLGTANLDNAYVVTEGNIVNVTAQSLSVLVCFNEAVHVTGTPTLDLTTTGTGTAANVRLSYNAATSDLTAGRILFSNLNFSLAHADYANTQLVLNSSSIVTGWNTIHDAASGVAIANGVVSTVEDAIEDPGLEKQVYFYVPLNSATTWYENPVANTGQRIGAIVKFRGNMPLTVTGTPTITAIANTGIAANVVLYYSGPDSSLSVGNVVFRSNAIDFSAITSNQDVVVNATSTLSGFSGIRDSLDQTPPNAIAVANDFIIVAPPIDTNVYNNTSPANSATGTVKFSVKFDRSVTVNTTGGAPTMTAISNNANVPNVSLLYASGSPGNTLLFSNTTAPLANGSNTVSLKVNATSVISFGRIYDTVRGTVLPVKEAVLVAANTVTIATA